MNFSTTDVLKDKKGIAEALGFTAITMTLLLAAAAVVADYGIHSRQAGLVQTTTQEVQNRAEEYVSHLNTNLVTPEVPSMARECSTTTKTCTQILSVTPNADGSKQVLRIQGDGATAFGQTITRDVTLVSSVETHVTAIDDAGNNVWANSGEGLQFKTWGVASGKPSDVDPDDLKGPSTDNSWVQVASGAGIDAKGRLWGWGENDHGQAGVGSRTSDSVMPKIISTEDQNFRSVVTDDDRSYAIDSSGFGWVWGKDDRGQLGDGGTADVTKPTKPTTRRWQTFAIGKDSVYGLTMAGDLFTSGATTSAAGVTVGPDAGDSWKKVNAGTRYTAVAASSSGLVAAIDQSGNLTSWGGTTTFSPNTSVKFRSVSVGGTVGSAISTDGTLYTWGSSTTGALGQGTTTSKATPTLASWAGVTGAAPRVVSVQAGTGSTLAIGVDGQLYYVGSKPAGTYSSLHTGASSFTKILPGTTFRQVSNNSADSSSALLDADGNLYGDGTPGAGLWSADYAGGTDHTVRMPAPAGFGSYTWKQ